MIETITVSHAIIRSSVKETTIDTWPVSIVCHNHVPSREPVGPENSTPKVDILNLYFDVCQKAHRTKISYLRHLAQFHCMTVTNDYSEPSNFYSKKSLSYSV